MVWGLHWEGCCGWGIGIWLFDFERMCFRGMGKCSNFARGLV